MAYEIGTLTGVDCHKQFVDKVKTVAENAGWVTQRTTATEWIGKSTGLSTTEEIYLGIMSYENVGLDYYNVLLGVFTGYTSGNTFLTQPGAKYSGVPAHNASLGYYLTANPQRIAFCLRVGPPVYMHGYMGKIFPYSPPSSFPYPVVCAGMLEGQAATRYDNAAIQMPYHGVAKSNQTMMYLRSLSGNWNKCRCHPFSQGSNSNYAVFGTSTCLVPPETVPPYTYHLEPIILQENSSLAYANIWGQLDGVCGVSGFGAVSENVIQEGGANVVDQTGMSVADAVAAILLEGGKPHIMLQNAYRNSFQDFIALEMS